MLIALPDGHAADVVADASPRRSSSSPRSCADRHPGITAKRWPAPARFKRADAVSRYILRPRSPWQRGSNENTNGLLRQYFPKRTEIAHFTSRSRTTLQQELRRPRQTRMEITITSTRRRCCVEPLNSQPIRAHDLRAERTDLRT